jgi:ATP-binding cassette subfamily B protein
LLATLSPSTSSSKRFAIHTPPISQPAYDHQQAVFTNRLQGLWHLMTGYRVHYGLAIVFQGVSAVSKMATLLVLRHFIDYVLVQPNPLLVAFLPGHTLPTSGVMMTELAAVGLPVENIALTVLFWVALAFIFFALGEGLFSFWSGVLAAQTGEGIALRLKNYMFDHLQRMTFRYHDKGQTGDLLQRSTSDVDSIRRFFVEQGVGVGRIVLLFIVNFIGIALIHWQLALFSSIVIPVIIVVSIWFFQKVSEKYELFQEQESVLSTRLQEHLTGMRVVKAFARQKYEIDRFEKENLEYFKRGRNELIWHSFYWPVTDLITGVQLVAGYLAAALMVLDGVLTVGDYIAYSGMLIYIIYPIRNLGRIVVQMSTGLVSYDRVKQVIEQDREPLGEDAAAPVADLKGEIVFKDVSFEYDPNIPVLKAVSFHVQPGQMIALMGSTGSGKTTVVNLLTRFYEYGEGVITLDGFDLKQFPRDFLRRNIGIVEQEPFLFSRTIRENITYGVGREVSDAEVERAAKAAAIHHVILSFPEGYNTLVGERGVTLSGGQKQRIAIARTLLKNPKILILDDATSSVDTETEAAIRTALKAIMPDRTTFVIAHRIQTVMSADLILVFDQGCIVQAGTHQDLLRDEQGFYRRIYDMQSKIDEELEKEMSVG